jgi:hypothetical protein
MKSARSLLALGAALAIVSNLHGGRGDAGLILFPAYAAEETSAELLAVQIRKQGHPCDKPLGAERDAERSKPDEAVWVLKCGDATYRMRLIPDMAAKVERLE